MEPFAKHAAMKKLAKNEIDGLIDLHKKSLMSTNEAKDFIRSLSPEWSKVIDAWNSSPLAQITLTSVGVAIGNANLRKVHGSAPSLHTWI